MKRELPAPPLLVITDRLSARKKLSGIVSAVLRSGCRWMMVREKDLGTAELGELAKEVVAQARLFDGHVTVNGDIEAVIFSGAAGVHLQNIAQVAFARERLGGNALVGISAHTAEEASAAARAGADYVMMSPIFLTDSKPGYGPALGIDVLEIICQQLDLPVIALAGITSANAASCLNAGAAAVAVMGAVVRSDAPGSVVRDILQSIRD